MNKLMVIGFLGLLLVGFVSATIIYSKPTYQDGSKINWEESEKSPVKIDCQRNEWNEKFKDYRAEIISKEEMKNYVGGCKW